MKVKSLKAKYIKDEDIWVCPKCGAEVFVEEDSCWNCEQPLKPQIPTPAEERLTAVIKPADIVVIVGCLTVIVGLVVSGTLYYRNKAIEHKKNEYAKELAEVSGNVTEVSISSEDGYNIAEAIVEDDGNELVTVADISDDSNKEEKISIFGFVQSVLSDNTGFVIDNRDVSNNNVMCLVSDGNIKRLQEMVKFKDIGIGTCVKVTGYIVDGNIQVETFKVSNSVSAILDGEKVYTPGHKMEVEWGTLELELIEKSSDLLKCKFTAINDSEHGCTISFDALNVYTEFQRIELTENTKGALSLDPGMCGTHTCCWELNGDSKVVIEIKDNGESKYFVIE